MAQIHHVSPISGEDTNALPVKDLGPAISFYETVLGFALASRDTSTATLKRGDIQIGLIRDADHEPGRAGSLALAVDDLEAMHHELQANGGSPGKFGVGEWSGKRFRTFFLREEENGYCFCFHCPL